MSISPVDPTRSKAPFMAVAGLCALGVGLLVVIVSLLSSALEGPGQAAAIPPAEVHQPGAGVTLQPHGSDAEGEAPVQAAGAPALVAVGPPAPPAPVRSLDDDLPPVTRVDNADFPRGKRSLSKDKGRAKDKDKDDGKGDFFDGDVGHRQLASKSGSGGSVGSAGHDAKGQQKKSDDHGKAKAAKAKGGKGPKHGKAYGRGKSRHHLTRRVG